MATVGRQVKESMLKELSSSLTERPNFFVTTVNRLPAAEADALRQKLFASRARFVLVQRRLGLRAIEALKVPGIQDLFEGSIGLVLPSEDVLPTAKLIVEFIKTHENQLAVRGALVDGQLIDAKRVEQLASLPPKPVLLAQVVGMIEAPLADVIFTIERLVGDIAWLAEQAAAKKSAEASTPPATPEPTTPESTPPSSPPAQSHAQPEQQAEGGT